MDEAALFTSRGSVLAVAGISGSTLTPDLPPPQAMRRAALQQTYARSRSSPDQGLVLRVVVPVNTSNPDDPLRVLQVLQPVPQATAARRGDRADRLSRLPGTRYSRGALKRLYGLTLTLTLLLALFSALGLAVVLSEQFSRSRWACWPKARARSRRATSAAAHPVRAATSSAC